MIQIFEAYKLIKCLFPLLKAKTLMHWICFFLKIKKYSWNLQNQELNKLIALFSEGPRARVPECCQDPNQPCMMAEKHVFDTLPAYSLTEFVESPKPISNVDDRSRKVRSLKNLENFDKLEVENFWSKLKENRIFTEMIDLENLSIFNL